MERLAVAVAVVVMAVTVQAQNRQSCTTEEGTTGTCSPIRECPALLSLLDLVRSRRAPPGSLQRLRRAICTFQNNEPLVCCSGQSPPGPVTQPPQTPPPPRPPTGGNFPVHSRCGVSALTDRIIDGEDAPLLAWPWMAVLRGTVNGGRSTWFCGGVLLNDRYVLTAAHCFKPRLNVQLEYVRIGEHTLSKNPDCERGVCAPEPQDLTVSENIPHPEYGRPCPECNDIALLRLANPAVLHPIHVMPICLPIDPQRDMGFPESEFQGKHAWAAGWGSISSEPRSSVIPDKLQQVLLPVQRLQFCQRLQRNYPDPRMTLCAGGEGKDTCRGDSGGPLVLSNTVDTRKFVVGITSRGPEFCGTPNTQGLYTNVAFYVPWILNTMHP